MTSDTHGTTIAEHKDKRVRLVIAGLLQLLLGGVCSLFFLFMLVFVFIALAVAEQPLSFKGLASNILPSLVYGVGAVWFCFMGLGTIALRRWARALSLAAAWIWLVCGTGGFVFNAIFLPGFYRQLFASEELPPNLLPVLIYAVLVMLAFMMVIVPGVLVLLYSGRHVKATFERHHQEACWTDRCPLPVLALSLFLIGWGFMVILVALPYQIFPFFGMMLSGAPAVIIGLLVTILIFYTAWGAYTLQLNAWRCALALAILLPASFLATFELIGMEQLLALMEIPQEDLEVLNLALFDGSPLIIGSTIAWIIGLAGYVVYTKRFFAARQA